MSAQTRSEIMRLLEEHGLRPVHRLGQNFLADPNITRKIVALAGVGPGDKVIEVGAGTGTLTRALASTGAHVLAFEVDHRLGPVLAEATSGLEVTVRIEDATKVDLAAVLGEGRWVMVANLPYQVGTPLVLEALQRVPMIELFVVMVQREVAERLAASPGSSEYGLPSVVAGLYADVSIAFRVSSQVFYPPPRVESAVVILRRREPEEDAEKAVTLARAAFGQRRKTLRRSLTSALDDPVAVLTRAGVDHEARAGDLSPSDYLRLAREVT